MSALIDCDYIVYKSCTACEYDVDWGNDVILVQSISALTYLAPAGACAHAKEDCVCRYLVGCVCTWHVIETQHVQEMF